MSSSDLLTIPVTPAMRGLAAGALTAAALWSVKPEAFFRRDTGEPRLATWAVARPDQYGRATPLPWYAAVAAVALGVALFT